MKSSKSERTDKVKEKKKSDSKKSKSGGSKRTAVEEEEIRQANELRAELGLKPLKD